MLSSLVAESAPSNDIWARRAKRTYAVWFPKSFETARPFEAGTACPQHYSAMVINTMPFAMFFAIVAFLAVKSAMGWLNAVEAPPPVRSRRDL